MVTHMTVEAKPFDPIAPLLGRTSIIVPLLRDHVLIRSCIDVCMISFLQRLLRASGQ